ncbi:MAG: hypothetical protein V1706_16205 [Pseudomonadota bacterium]
MKRRFFLLALLVVVAGVPGLSRATPHGEAGIRCLDCHVSTPLPGFEYRFHDDLHALCLGCHTKYSCKPDAGDGYFRHPVSVVPSFPVPADMPLDVKKRMGCITCHLFHDEQKANADLHPRLLRRPPGSNFCLTCHARLPGK